MVDDAAGASTSSWIPPMNATIGELPTRAGWGFELKWDGMRLGAICAPDPAQLELRSRSGRDVTSSFPELVDLPATLGAPATFDGEAVVFDADRPSFERLQHRMHVERPTASLVARHPIVYIVFDLLVLDGRPLLDLPYRDRHRLLKEFLDDGPTWRVPPIVEGDGQPLLDLARSRGLEGVMAKRLDSRYEPGNRSSNWRKVKIRLRQEFVLVGWLPGQGTLTGQIGSLLLAVWDGPRLRFAGAVGSGLAERDRVRLAPLVQTVESCPLDEVPALDKPPSWIEPTLVVEVEYGSWPADGLLRHPVYAGLRVDVDPGEVTRELER